jgi:hypothetical protein
MIRADPLGVEAVVDRRGKDRSGSSRRAVPGGPGVAEGEESVPPAFVAGQGRCPAASPVASSRKNSSV